jgi:hypothetical protein
MSNSKMFVPGAALDGLRLALEAENKKLRAEIARLRARVEVLERDASRYQWLKNRKWMSLQTSYMKWIRKDSTSFIASHDLAADGTQYAPYETLDETIDAAMKKAKP